MQFVYDQNASNEILELHDDNYKYIIKARRHKLTDKVYFRNLQDDFLYEYEIFDISKKSASCKLISKEEKIVKNNKSLNLVWCVVDPKTVEKSIASLNELGLEKITFIYCEYSQKNFKLNIEKLNKILINSSSQCGRSSIIKLEIYDDTLEQYLNENPDNTYFLDFSKNSLDDKKDSITNLVLGCEGGFSNSERNIIDDSKKVGFKSNLILKSETAAVCAVSKILI